MRGCLPDLRCGHVGSAAGFAPRPTVSFILALPICLWAASASGAVIGHVVSFSTAGQEITFNLSDGAGVRIAVLASDLARIRIAPDGAFSPNVSRAVVKTDWPAAAFDVIDDGAAVAIATPAMRLTVLKSPFVLECRDPAGRLMLTDDPVRRIQWDGARTQIYKTTQPGESYLGLGWRPSGGLRRNGTAYLMKNVPSYGSPDSFYGGIPLWYGVRDGSAYGVFFDDTSWGTIDMTTSGGGYMSFRNRGGTADYYYFAGPGMAGVLDRYTELTGRPFMPPRWACGYQQSRWSYTPQSEVLAVAAELRAREIPCDAIYLDVDYMDPAEYQLSFKPATFPDPAGMIAALHAQGFRTIANVENFLVEGSAKWSQAVAGGHLIRNGASPHRGWYDYVYFVMGAPTGWVSWVDLTRPAARSWFRDRHMPFLAHGIDGLWNDKNEPEELGGAWPTTLTYDNEGSPASHAVMGTQHCLFHTAFSYDTLAGRYPDRRPFVLSRAACAGIQRSAAVWSGDNTSKWAHLQLNIPMGLSMSISGQPHNGHDIGGFFNDPPGSENPVSAELYARWMQWGVFTAFCRQHHYGNGNHGNCPYVEPWQFGPTIEGICRDYIRLRYRLMPYLYTLFHRAHAAGEPIHRPTFYDFPGDPAVLAQDYAFMFGPFMLISPVTSAGAVNWDTYLPASSQWISWWDDSLHDGGTTVTTPAPLSRMPIFVRAGAIIPTAPASQFDGQAPLDVMTLELYPVNAESRFTLYEDDGISWAYQAGQYARTGYTMTGIGDTFTLDVAAREGSFVPAPRDLELKVHRWPGHTRTASIDGVALVEHATREAFEAAGKGIYLDQAAGILHARFADTGQAMRFAFGGTPVPDVPGDLNRDGDVDQEDFSFLQACLAGMGIPVSADCRATDLDRDSDVDGQDVRLFLGCMSGPEIIGDPDCLP